jgi:hypothetical protein
MKKLLLVLASIALLTSCYDEGEVISTPHSIYEINGKQYKFLQISPSNYSKAVWIMIPLDSNTETPEVIVTNQSSGKSNYNQSTIILK